MTTMSGSGAPRRLLRVGALVATPLTALVAAWWFTRSPDAAPAPETGGHDHAAMAAAGGGASSVRLTADQAARIGVTYAAATLGPLATEVRTVGEVVVDESRVHTVALRVDGWVESLAVDRTGVTVRAGTPLLTLHSPMVASAQEELLLALRLAAEVREDARARAAADELVRAARRRLAWWEVPDDVIAALERTGEVQRSFAPRAPAGGVVLEKAVTAGQRVMAGEALYRIADLSSVWVEGEVFERDLRDVALGQQATASFDALPDAAWRGRVTFVSPVLSAETRTARVRVAFANPGGRLKPGMFATLRLAGPDRGPVVSVPRSAVLATGERTLVFVRAADGALVPREVVAGRSSDARTEIVRGLAAGEVVVASATFLVDAESNLGTALGGMGAMPGMEITTPPERR